MFHIDHIVRINGLTIVRGWGCNTELPTIDNVSLEVDTHYVPVLVLSCVRRDVNNAHNLDADTKSGFELVFKIDSKRHLNFDTILHYLDKSIDLSDELKKVSIHSYFNKIFGDINAVSSSTIKLLKFCLSHIGSNGYRILEFPNIAKKRFGIFTYKREIGYNTTNIYSLSINNKGICERLKQTYVPSHKKQLKRVIPTCPLSDTIIIINNEKGLKNSELIFKPLTRLKAYSLIIKKLSRVNVGRKNYSNKRMLTNTVQFLRKQSKSKLFNMYDKLQQGNMDASNYSKFIEEHEPKIENKIRKLLRENTAENKPLISLITPTYNTSPELFDELYDSINEQVYQNWEWIIVDDCSPDEDCVAHIEERVKSDSRIQLIKAKENGHISRATNIGLDKSKGSIIAFADHDDLLSRIAFAAIIVAYYEHPNAKWFYSDEDFISVDGVRHSPHLKSAFNPALLKTHNYITHLSAVKRELIEKISCLDSECDGAQDFDLHLRLAQELEADEIVHIPLVLYHWRQVEGSTAMDSSAKSYTHEAGINALNKVSKQAKVKFKIDTEASHDNYFKVDSANNYKPLVSIIIPFRDYIQLLKNCIRSIDTTCKKGDFELVLVNNGSTDQESLDFLEDLRTRDDVNIVDDNNDFNFSRLINNGAKASKGEVLLLLNNDIEAIRGGWLEELRDLSFQDTVGCVGCKLIYPDTSIQHAGIGLGLGGYAAHFYRGQHRDHPGNAGRLYGRFNVSGVTAAALAVKKTIFDRVGGFSEEFKVGYNDVDFNLKVFSAGYWNICTCHAELVHFESKTRGHDSDGEKKARFEKEKKLLAERWTTYIVDDPFYHPFLTRMREDCSFADPHEWNINSDLLKGRRLNLKQHTLSI